LRFFDFDPPVPAAEMVNLYLTDLGPESKGTLTTWANEPVAQLVVVGRPGTAGVADSSHVVAFVTSAVMETVPSLVLTTVGEAASVEMAGFGALAGAAAPAPVGATAHASAVQIDTVANASRITVRSLIVGSSRSIWI
jgi:hypothetical protein